MNLKVLHLLILRAQRTLLQSEPLLIELFNPIEAFDASPDVLHATLNIPPHPVRQPEPKSARLAWLPRTRLWISLDDFVLAVLVPFCKPGLIHVPEITCGPDVMEKRLDVGTRSNKHGGEPVEGQIVCVILSAERFCLFFRDV